MFERRDNRVLILFVAFYLLFIILLFSFGSVERVLGQTFKEETVGSNVATSGVNEPAIFTWLSQNAINSQEQTTYRGNTIIKLDGPDLVHPEILSLAYRSASQAIDETLVELREQGMYGERIRSSIESNYRLMGPGGEILLLARRNSIEAASGSNYVIRLLDPVDRTNLGTFRLKPQSLESLPVLMSEDGDRPIHQFYGKILLQERRTGPFLIEIEDRYRSERHLYEITPKS